MSSNTAFTIENAPRDLEALKAMGRFNFRNIATALGLMDTEEKKAAFMGLDNAGMAGVILPLLQEFDKKKGGGGAAATKPAAAPVRTPVTAAAGSAPAQAAASAPAGGAAPNGQLGILQIVQAIESMKLAQQESSKTANERLDNIESYVAELQTTLRGTNRILLTSMALNLFLAEEVLKAPRSEVIKTAHDDVESLIASLAALDPGIEEATSEEGEEGGEEAEGGKG